MTGHTTDVPLDNVSIIRNDVLEFFNEVLDVVSELEKRIIHLS